MSHRIDLGTGNVFGQWTTIGPEKTPRRANSFWWCKCECGTVKTVRSADLRSGRSSGCGCKKNAKLTRHGDCKRLTPRNHHTIEYNTRARMIGRCYNPETKGFERYGGRGIKMCAEWRESFVAFLRDMGRRPTGTSIDRIDNDGDYSPANCRWATPREQSRNRRSTRWVVYNGEKLTTEELSAKVGRKEALRIRENG